MMIRQAEWVTSIALFSWGVVLLLPGNSMSTPAYTALTGLMTETQWALVCLCVSMPRLAALWVNGNWFRTPLFRCGGAIIGAGFWAMLSALFFQANTPGFSTAVPIYAVLAASDMFSASRAADDMVHARRAVRHDA